MIVNVNNVVDGLVNLLELNRSQIDTLVNLYSRGRRLTILKGRRNPVAADLMPCLMIDPEDSRFDWEYCRTQREDINITMELVVFNGNENFQIEYLGLLTTLISRIVVWPRYLRRRIPGTGFALSDSRIETVRYGQKDGNIRVATLNWTGWVLEQFGNEVFVTGPNNPCQPSDNLIGGAGMNGAGGGL